MAGLFHSRAMVVSPMSVNVTPNGSLQAMEEKSYTKRQHKTDHLEMVTFAALINPAITKIIHYYQL